ncbi:MAG: hypothetical protein ABIC04_02155 [Nanoarchaeota archaeon]
MLFRKKKTSLQVQDLHNQLDSSFNNVRQDIYNIFSWLNYLNERILGIQKQFDYLPNSREDIKKIIDSYYSFDDMSKKIEALNSQVASVQAFQNSVPSELEQIREKLKQISSVDGGLVPIHRTETKTEAHKLDEINDRLKRIEDQKKKNIRETMVNRITKNSKEYVKNIIVSLIQKYGKIPALKLKEMIVDEQGLCSKSSFYRLLNEVQLDSVVSVAHKGKEKQMVFKLSRNN